MHTPWRHSLLCASPRGLQGRLPHEHTELRPKQVSVNHCRAVQGESFPGSTPIPAFIPPLGMLIKMLNICVDKP